MVRLYERSATLSALQLSAQGRPGDLPLLTLNDTLTTYGQGGNGEVLAVVDGRVPSAWIPSPHGRAALFPTGVRAVSISIPTHVDGWARLVSHGNAFYVQNNNLTTLTLCF